jgi:hypothetical protein
MPCDAFPSPGDLSRRAALKAAAAIGAVAATLGSGGTVGHATAQEATPSAADSDLAVLIRATERERLRALVDADMEVAARLHADDVQLINPPGGTLSKDEYLGGIASGALDYLVFEPASEIRVRLYGKAAVIRYQSHLQIAVDGQDLGLGNVWHTDVYELRDGRWQAVWSQATSIH